MRDTAKDTLDSYFDIDRGIKYGIFYKGKFMSLSQRNVYATPGIAIGKIVEATGGTWGLSKNDRGERRKELKKEIEFLISEGTLEIKQI